VLVSGMAIGTVFTLFVVPVYYSLIAAQHKPVVMTGEFPVQTPQLATAAAH
jgi:multidrug efflux pump